MEIRITDVPPGEAPEWVRQAWVGLSLPLASGEYGPRAMPTGGVLTGPRGCATAVLHLLTGKVRWKTGYVVDAELAVCLLEENDPEAAEWWRDNAPHAIRPGRHFVFPAEVCSEQRRRHPEPPPPPRGDEGITR